MPSMTPRGLVETIRLQDGRPCWLDRHQARLDFSWAALLPGSAPRLDRLLPRESTGDHLLRLAFRARDPDAVETERSERPLRPLARPVRVALARAPRQEQPEQCRHKVADRSWLEPLVVAGTSETLLWSRDGLLLEGTRSNLFLYGDGGWCTPPREDGLVPGVVRGRVLQCEAGRGISLTSWGRDRLQEVEAMVLSGAGIGLVPVASLGDRSLDQARARDLVDRIGRALATSHGGGPGGSVRMGA